MQIETIHETELTASDEAQINALLNAAFDSDFDSRSFYQQRPHLRLITRAEGQIVGHMAMFYRAIRQGEALIDVVGLGDVSTHPDHRGQGIASALMKASIETARATRAPFFLLFGDRPLYAGHGFVRQHNPYRYIDLMGARTGAVTEAVAEWLMVLSLDGSAWDGETPIDLLGHSF